MNLISTITLLIVGGFSIKSVSAILGTSGGLRALAGSTGLVLAIPITAVIFGILLKIK